MFDQIKELVLAFPPGFWTILGACLILTDFILYNSRQLFLAGIGALTLALFLSYKLIALPDFFSQFVAFFTFTVFWSLALWLPLMLKDRWMNRYSYLRGSYCIILNQDLQKGRKGFGKINELTLPVRMQPDSAVDIIHKNDRARILRTKGALLIVEPTSVPMPSESDLKKYRQEIKILP